MQTKTLCLLIVLFTTVKLFAQFDSLKQSIADQDSINFYKPREKIFIFTDKPDYQLNDTMWLSGFTVDAATHFAFDSSNIVYLELWDSNEQLIKRIAIPNLLGCFNSNITLDKQFQQGFYKLRAYTWHMQDYGDSLFYEKQFRIIDPNAPVWKIGLQNLTFTQNKLAFSAIIADNSKEPFPNEKINILFKSKKKKLFDQTIVTDSNGYIHIDTLLTSAYDSSDLNLEIKDKKSTAILQIPVHLSKTGKIDLQFLPEGGNLIADFDQIVGFKAVDADGKSVKVNGVIKNNANTIVAHFSSIYNGMGFITLKTEPNQKYIAFLDDGSAFNLPEVKPRGSILHVTHNNTKDSTIIVFKTTPDQYNLKFFIGSDSRGINNIKGMFTSVPEGKEFRFANKIFPSGINRITIYDQNSAPINERAFFVEKREDSLKLSLQANKDIFANKDSVHFDLVASDYLDKPLTGSFTVSVMDTSQVSINLDQENIESYFWLQSDLKGTIETPAVYLKYPYSDTTDALLLTQGWVNYNFENVNLKKYPYEKSFSLSGKVTNIWNKPISESKIGLWAKDGKSGFFTKDTTTNSRGEFTFDNFPVFNTDSSYAVLNALNKKNKANNINIELIEKQYPSDLKNNLQWGSIFYDSVSQSTITKHKILKDDLKKAGKDLNEVIVVSKVKIEGSKNLNPDGGSDLSITKNIIDKTPKATLLDVLFKNIVGFRRGDVNKSIVNAGISFNNANNQIANYGPKLGYLLSNQIVRFIIDGMLIDNYYFDASGSPSSYMEFENQYLESILAEEVKGIEVMKTPNFNETYRFNFLSDEERMRTGPGNQKDYAFIEITTFSGNGAFFKSTPGRYATKLNAPYWGKQFYSPKYTSPTEPTAIPDIRSTLYWNPDIITNQEGKASFSFYTSESHSSYMLFIQGTDSKGKFGARYIPITIK